MKRLTKIGLVVFLLLSSNASAHRDTTEAFTRAVYLEIGGPGIVASTNFQRTFFDGRAAARAGIGVKGLWTTRTVFPLALSALLGQDQHKLEVGTGVVVPGHSIRSTYPTAVLGVRVQPADKRFFFRQAFTPYWDGEHVRRWIGFSIGFAF